MTETVQPGSVTSRVRWLIGTACAVTLLLAAIGMQEMWNCVVWIQRSWGAADPEAGAFWYRHGLALAVTAAIALAWLPRFPISRLLRVAVVLPLVHLAAIVAAGRVWSVFEGGLANLDGLRFKPDFMEYVHVTTPSACVVGLVFAALVLIGIVIKRRHGEWAHATVMLALSYLLLLGMWLPVVARMAVGETSHRYWTYTVRVLDTDTVAWLATVPTALIAIAFSLMVFRLPATLSRMRPLLRPVMVTAFVLALMVAASLPNKSWLVYLESSYLLMTAVVLAVASVTLLVAVTWIRSLLAHRRARGVTYTNGVVSADDDDVARYEVTSWLRGPRLVVGRFVVTTPHGDVPVHGAPLLVAVPAASTTLDVGEHVPVLRAGDRVVLAARTAKADGHPFRASDAGEITAVATPDAHRLRFSDIALVVWRPAVAYLAILVAVAAPYLTIFLTD